MIPYAYITAAELKMRGINEQFIAHVEEKRPHLQRFIEQHQEMKRKQTMGGGAGAVNNTPGLGMGLSGLSGTQPQQAQLQPQMVLNAPQQMNPNVRQGIIWYARRNPQTDRRKWIWSQQHVLASTMLFSGHRSLSLLKCPPKVPWQMQSPTRTRYGGAQVRSKSTVLRCSYSERRRSI
jgi:hypothetical protein